MDEMSDPLAIRQAGPNPDQGQVTTRETSVRRGRRHVCCVCVVQCEAELHATWTILAEAEAEARCERTNGSDN